MKLTKETTNLICELEKIIGNECYNPNSFNGWTLEEGCSFRYPVTYTGKDGSEKKAKYSNVDLDKECMHTLHYKFGSNYLFIGNGLFRVLEHLEQLYGLDFNELAKK